MKTIFSLCYMHRIKGKEPDQEAIISTIIGDRAAPSLLEGYDAIEDITLNDSGFYDEKLPDGSSIRWILPHNREFPTFINKYFGENPEYISSRSNFIEDIKKAILTGADSSPFAYQKFIRDYMRFGTPYRGLLLEHGLGSGKSRSSILVAETFRKQKWTTLILTPAFLKLNFLDEIQRWGDDDIKITNDMSASQKEKRMRIINTYYKFVHYNASGLGLKAGSRTGNSLAGKSSVFEQLAKLGIGFEESDPVYGNVFPYLNEKYPGLKPPRKMLIIIEEIHDMNRSFVKGPKSLRYFLYPLLMKAKDCKIIGLSGTPIISSPFEMSTLYNILRGPIKKTVRALPEDEASFNRHFIDYNTLSITNQDIMGARIVGLSSLFTGITDDVDRVIYPSGKDESMYITKELLMSDNQGEIHDFTFENESKAIDKKKPKNLSAQNLKNLMNEEKNKLEVTSSYYVKSRQAANFVFPSEILRPRGKPQHHKSWELLKDHVFEFSINSGNAADYHSIWHFLSEQFDLDDYEDQYARAHDNNDIPYIKSILSDIIKQAYNEDPPVKKQHAAMLANIFSDNDKLILHLRFGDYSQSLLAAIKIMSRDAQKYFTLHALKNMYSVKMESIYRDIVSDIEHGASYVDYTSQPEKPDTDEPDQEDIVIGDDEEDDELDRTTIDLSDVNVTKIDDPDDPFIEKRFQDVYLPDDQIKGVVKGGPALVYSYFNTAEGVGIFSKILEAHGFTEFNDKVMLDTQKPETVKRAPRYAFVKGGMRESLKIKIMRAFNSKANAHGQLIKVIFATPAAGQGISLFNLRQIHIMEPHWDNELINQVIGRGFRLLSHKHLPKEEREIQVYHYYAISKQELSVDKYIKSIADKKSKINDQLRYVRAMAAVDCKINSEYNKFNINCLTYHGSGLTFTENIDSDVSNRVKVKTNVVKLEYKVIEHNRTNYVIMEDVFIEVPVVNKKDAKKGRKTLKAQRAYRITGEYDPNKPLNKDALNLHGYYYIKKKADGSVIYNLFPLNKDILEK